MRFATIILLIFISIATQAQEVPIGGWQSFLSYYSAQSAAVANDKVYSGNMGLLSYNMVTNEYQHYSKVNGLNDADIIKLGFNPSNEALIIAYDNSNIDILQNDMFYSLPDLKNSNVIASKKISNLIVYKNNAYLSTALGIIVIDMLKKEFKSTYSMIIDGEQSVVLDVAFANDSIYACTTKGLYAANENSLALEDIANWNRVDKKMYTKMAFNDAHKFVVLDTAVYDYSKYDTSMPIYSFNLKNSDLLLTPTYLHIGLFDGGGLIARYHLINKVIDEAFGLAPKQLAAKGEEIWMGDAYFGLTRIINNDQRTTFTIPGPINGDAFNAKIINDELYVLAGGTDDIWGPTFNGGGISVLNNNNYWKNYSTFSGYSALGSTLDILDVVQDPISKNLFAPAFTGGLAQINTTANTVTTYTTNNPFDTEPLKKMSYAKNDPLNNIWFSIGFSNKTLGVRKADGTWASFTIPTTGDFTALGEIEIDDALNKWVVLPRSRGLLVFNENNTFDNTNDDLTKLLSNSPTNGNLISNNTLTLAKDRNGKIWVGTDKGISIYNCPESIFSTGSCPAENKIVQYDNIAAAPLFENESVNTIAVDGANRKWVGTNTGAYLISEDAEQVIYRFNSNNSPLPSSVIRHIVIHPVTGEVFFCTTKGIYSFRSTATVGNTNSTPSPIVFPNPITGTYKGTIAIKNIITDGDVRIIDAAGQLVYRTKALGGQAVWNGLTYTGHQPQSGIYTVLINSTDGSKKQTTTFTFVK
jgi:hypothetical protein